MMDGRYLPLIALGGGIMGGRLGRGLQGYAQAVMQGQAMDREGRLDQMRQKQLDIQTQAMEAEAAQRRAQEDAINTAAANMDPQMANLLRAGGPAAFNAYVQTKLTPPKANSEIGQINADYAAGFIDEAARDAAIRKLNYIAPQAPRDSFRLLTPEELKAEGYAPGTVVEVNTLTNNREVVQSPQTRGNPIFQDQRQTDGSVQRVVSYDNGASWQTFGAAETQQPKPIPTADGRLVESDGKGGYRDVTPAVAGVDMMEQPAPTPVGPDMENAVGIGPVAAEALSKTAGQFIAGANNPDVTEARTRLQLLTRQAQSAFALSGRPTNWEQQRISSMLPSDGVFESPDRARTALGVLKEDATRAYNEYGQLLQSPSLGDGPRAELMQKRLELKRLVESIEVGPAKPSVPIVADPVRPDWNPDEAGVPVFKMVNGKLQRVSP